MRIGVIIALVATLVCNGLANALPLNGLRTGEISNRFPSLITPAGYAFSIWGLIYLLLGIYAVFQLLPAQRDNQRLRRVAPLFIVSCLGNCGWIFLWHYEQFPLTLLAMGLLIISLAGIYLRLDIGRSKVTTAERYCVNAPFSIYLGWITVATIVNVAVVLLDVHWSGWGISPKAWAVTMLAVATCIAGVIGLTRRDPFYLLVIIWALIAVALKQRPETAVSVTAWVTSALVFVLLTVIMALHIRRGRQATGGIRAMETPK